MLTNQKKTWMTTLAATFALCAAGVAGAQQTHYWDGGASTTSWHDAGNWDTNTVPNSVDDQVIIGDAMFASNVTVDIDNASPIVGQLTIRPGSNLRIGLNTAGSLIIDRGTSSPTLPGNFDLQQASGGASFGAINIYEDSALVLENNNTNHNLEGLINLQEQGASIVVAGMSAEFATTGTGPSTVSGFDDQALIEIGDSLTLTFNAITLEGRMVIAAPSEKDLAFFVNHQGVVDANGGGTMLFDTSVEVYSQSDVKEKVYAMWISRESTSNDPSLLRIERPWDNSLSPNFEGEVTVHDCSTFELGADAYIYIDSGFGDFLLPLVGTVTTGTNMNEFLFTDSLFVQGSTTAGTGCGGLRFSR